MQFGKNYTAKNLIRSSFIEIDFVSVRLMLIFDVQTFLRVLRTVLFKLYSLAALVFAGSLILFFKLRARLDHITFANNLDQDCCS